MTPKTYFTGVAALAVAAAGLFFGPSPGLSADISAILKEARARSARFEEAVRDMSIVQETVTLTPRGRVVSEGKMLKKGEKFRVETSVKMPPSAGGPPGSGAGQTIVLYDGQETWMISPLTGKRKIPADQAPQYHLERHWVDSVASGARLVGTEKVGLRECYLIEVEPQNQRPFTKLWLDKKSLVRVKAEGRGPQGQKVQWLYSDFRKVEGDWEVPYKTEMFVEGQLVSSTLVKSLQINQGLSDDLFEAGRIEAPPGPDLQELRKRMPHQGGGR